MKVLQVLPELNSGGVERGTQDVAGHLARAGHESLVLSNGGRLVQKIEAEGSRHLTLPVHRKSLWSLRLVPHLGRLLREEQPDIVHVRSRAPAWITWLAWRRMDPVSRPRLVSTVHGFYSAGPYSRVMSFGERVIAPSEASRDYILSHYPKVPEERIVVIPRGIDPAEFPPDYQPSDQWLNEWQTRHPELGTRFVVTLPGRIAGWKGHRQFITLIADLRSRGVPVHGLVAGGSHPHKSGLERELRREARSRGMEDFLSFLGDRRDLRDVMAVSSVIVSLSSKPEAFGRVTLEALSLGRPVAGYAHGGVADQLAKLMPAGAVPPGDHDAMVELLVHWHKNGVPNRPGPIPLPWNACAIRCWRFTKNSSMSAIDVARVDGSGTSSSNTCR